jgi:creatinine amidohydrolase
LKLAGFKTICFIGDHGGSQAAQAEVASRLSTEWGASGVKVLHVADYYSDAEQIRFLREKGETPEAIGSHAGMIDTSELMSVHPQGIDLSKLRTASAAIEIPGHSGDPTRATAEYGSALLDIRVHAAIQQIRQTLSEHDALRD